jgi:hypothetical protein
MATDPKKKGTLGAPSPVTSPLSPNPVMGPYAPGTPYYSTGPQAGGLNPIQGIRDGIVSALTGGKATSAAQYDADVAAKLAASKASPTGVSGVGTSVGGGSDPYASALAQAQAAYGTGRNDLLANSNRADQDLAQIFQRTMNGQKLLQSNAIQGFHANNARLGSTYDDLLGRIGSSYSAGGNSLANELSRLGLGEAAPGASQGLIRDSGFLTDMAHADKANALSNNNSMSSLIANLMSETRAATGAAGTSARAQNRIETQKGLAALAQQLAASKANIAGGRSASGKALAKTPEQKAADYIAYQKALEAGGYGKKGKTSTQKGTSDALAFLEQYAGGDQQKASDLENEFRFLQTIPGGQDAWLAHLYGKDPTTGQDITAGINNWKKKGLPYGQQDADAVANAVAILLGKY